MREIFASYSVLVRRLRVEGERRITQCASILSRLASSCAKTKDLPYPWEAEMSLSIGYCDLSLTYKTALSDLTCKAALLYTAPNEKS